MAKRKSARRRFIARSRENRVVISSARSSYHALRELSSPASLVLSPLRLIPLGDGRLYHPVRRMFRPVAAAPRSAARLVAKGTGIQFADPRRVLVCLRRNIRKEVLFALGVGGQGGAKKKPRRTTTSGISC